MYMEQKKIGQIISTKRKEKNLTQQELADILGVSPKTISKWETGNGLPDITFLKKISEILEITIEELLDGKIKEKEPKEDTSTTPNKIKNIYLIFILLIGIIFILIIALIINIKPDQTKKLKDNCTVIRTYYIDNIGKSNDENYLYITIHEFQVEGTYTLKLPMTISKDLEVGSSYEFTFKTTKLYTNTTTDNLFNNSEVINLKYTDKVGLDRTSKYYCEGDDINEK